MPYERLKYDPKSYLNTQTIDYDQSMVCDAWKWFI